MVYSPFTNPQPPESSTRDVRRGTLCRRWGLGALALLTAGCLVWLAFLYCGPLSKSRLEESFRRAGKHLLPVPTALPAGRGGWSVRFGRATLATHAVYLGAPTGRSYVYVDPAGTVRRPGRQATHLADNGEVLITAAGATLFIDGVAQDAEVSGWSLAWVTAFPQAPDRAVHGLPQVTVADDFMRESVVDNTGCRVSRGVVTLAQRGGGMASTTQQERDADFQRAVNPFSVFARENGTLSYLVPGAEYWGDVAAEARFYFGLPKTGNVVDINTLPVDTDMLVAQGPLEGEQIAFGWCGAARACRLLRRHADGPWQVLATWDQRRPPVTNWVRIGLALTRGHIAEGLLDGVPVLRVVLPQRVQGPFHVIGGQGLAEFDDVRAWSLPAEVGPGSPLCVKSRSFAGKREKGSHDPPQFRQWASSTGTFVASRSFDSASRTAAAAITTAMPLMGDFFYHAAADSQTGGKLPAGAYSFHLLRPAHSGKAAEAEALFSFEAERTDAGWVVPDLRRPDGGSAAGAAPLPELALARADETAGRLALWADGQWLPLSPPLPGPVQFRVQRSQPGENPPPTPAPEHHVLHCRNLVNEFFEYAPTEWSWLDGAFRMDCRWACEDQWSFMACGSPALPCMVSKRCFGGDQVHEYFLCLRATFPWDAGDTTFVYDPKADAASGFRMIGAHHGWYNRRDLNFSFCTDGVNPLSGYAVVFGADDNRETRLLRRGEIVASTREARFLFPTAPGHEAVHWNWWKFTVHKLGGRILVWLNDVPLFQYDDPEPLDGGHLAFWSIRNGFALSRLGSMAERLDWRPHDLYVTASGASPWVPLRGDTVTVGADPETQGLTRVINRGGGGFFAARWTPPAPVDLQATPRLELPLRLGPGTVVNLHLAIGGRAFLLRLGDAPLGATKALLTPESETGECFQLPDLPEPMLERIFSLGIAVPDAGVVRVDLGARLQAVERPPSTMTLSAITIGNTSNAGYLLAGHGGNPAGAWYAAGVPAFRAEPTK